MDPATTLLPGMEVPASPTPPTPAAIHLDRKEYNSLVAIRWHGEPLRDARGNWTHFQSILPQLHAAMLRYLEQHNGLTQFLWDLQPQLQPDKTRLDPLIDFCPHYQACHLRRGLVQYCTLILKQIQQTPKLPRYRTRPLTGYSKPNSQGFKPSHKWHPIYRRKGEEYEELWKRLEPHLLCVDDFPRFIDGVYVIAAVEGFLITLDPRNLWPVLHPYSKP